MSHQYTHHQQQQQQHHQLPKKCYYENLRCPSCIMSSPAQIGRYHGMPWLSYGNGSYLTNYDNIYEGLSAELEDFYQFIRPKAEDDALRKATFLCIAKSIKSSKKFDIEAVMYYGSFSSNTYLPVSDIDMVVIVPKENNVVAVLFEVAYLLFIDGIIEKHCSIIPHSRIPLLKFYDCMTGFQINVTINTPNVMERAEYIRQSFFPKSGVPGGKAAAAALAASGRSGGVGGAGQYELKILYFMKYYLLYRNSNQVYFGGIGSYALSLMVLRYFQEADTVEMIRRANAAAAKSSRRHRRLHRSKDTIGEVGDEEEEDSSSSISSSSSSSTSSSFGGDGGGGGQSSLLGRLLIGFLQRYSDVDFISKVIISVREGGAYIPAAPVVASQPQQQQQHQQQQQLLLNMSGSSNFSNDDPLLTGGAGGVGGGVIALKQPPSHFAGHYLNKKCSVLRIEDPREPWKNVSAGSFNSDIILADFGRLLQTLLNPKAPGGGLHGLYAEGQNTWSIIANGLTVVDSFVEYRAILKDIYSYWFPTAAPSKNSQHSSPRTVHHSHELYESFIQQRNIFGPRHIEFEYKRFDDNTAQLVLLDTQLPGTQGRPPSLPPLNYHHYHQQQQQQNQQSHGHGQGHQQQQQQQHNNHSHHHRQQNHHQQQQSSQSYQHHQQLNSSSTSTSSTSNSYSGGEHSQQGGGGGYSKHQANGGHYHHHHHNQNQQHYLSKKKSCSSVLRLVDTNGGGGGNGPALPRHHEQQWNGYHNSHAQNNNSRSSGGGSSSAHNLSIVASTGGGGGGGGRSSSNSDRKTRELKKILKIDFN